MKRRRTHQTDTCQININMEYMSTKLKLALMHIMNKLVISKQKQNIERKRRRKSDQDLMYMEPHITTKTLVIALKLLPLRRQDDFR